MRSTLNYTADVIDSNFDGNNYWTFLVIIVWLQDRGKKRTFELKFVRSPFLNG